LRRSRGLISKEDTEGYPEKKTLQLKRLERGGWGVTRERANRKSLQRGEAVGAVRSKEISKRGGGPAKRVPKGDVCPQKGGQTKVSEAGRGRKTSRPLPKGNEKKQPGTLPG